MPFREIRRLVGGEAYTIYMAHGSWTAYHSHTHPEKKKGERRRRNPTFSFSSLPDPFFLLLLQTFKRPLSAHHLPPTRPSTAPRIRTVDFPIIAPAVLKIGMRFENGDMFFLPRV